MVLKRECEMTHYSLKYGFNKTPTFCKNGNCNISISIVCNVLVICALESCLYYVSNEILLSSICTGHTSEYLLQVLQSIDLNGV